MCRFHFQIPHPANFLHPCLYQPAARKLPLLPIVLRHLYSKEELYVEPSSQIPALTSASIKESSKVETQMNHVIIRLTANTFTVITLSGLSNVGTRPDSCGNAQYHVWYGDSLEHVQSVKVVGDDVMSVAQWYGDSFNPENAAWYCSASSCGWIESSNVRFGITNPYDAKISQLTSQSWCQQ